MTSAREWANFPYSNIHHLNRDPYEATIFEDETDFSYWRIFIQGYVVSSGVNNTLAEAKEMIENKLNELLNTGKAR